MVRMRPTAKLESAIISVWRRREGDGRWRRLPPSDGIAPAGQEAPPAFQNISHQKSFSGFAERAMASATESEMDWIGHLLKDEFEFLRSR